MTCRVIDKHFSYGGARAPSETAEPPNPSEPITSISIERISICTRVVDGDTIKLFTGIEIRLADIDAPESTESGYERSTNALKSRVLNQKVYIDVDGIDSYGRYVCIVYVASGDRYKNINYALWKGDYADIWDHDNEFNPYSWSMFVSSVDISHADDDSDDYSPSEPDESEPPSWAVYVGSKKSDKYHRLSCYCARARPTHTHTHEGKYLFFMDSHEQDSSQLSML